VVEAPAARPVVIDTNIVLDLLVFADVAVQPLRPLLASGALRWIAAPRASAVCKDPDDQQFIDLAVHHGAILLSKDRAVLSLRKRLLALGAHAAPAIGALA